uniref:Uncharacterized protein n=1 Tax=Oryza sativa subsp. japonica TaxID=39947 RepID=Q2QP10_ORYSJ|nr:hypothetical protein LOC_Os12g36070 [Oryza sativa Japonica Group]
MSLPSLFFVSSLTPSPLSVPRGLTASTAFLQLQGGRAKRWHRRRRRWELSVARAIKSAADKRATSTNAEPYALLSAISRGPQELLSLISLIAAALAKTPKGSSGEHTTMDTRSPPVLLVEMAAYSSGALVREMSSGLVCLALE